MGVSKKPRKKYKPKHVRLDTVTYAVESATPLTQHDDYAVKHKLRVSGALAEMVKGVGTTASMTYLYASYNVALSITDMKGLQAAAVEILLPALQAIEALAVRYREHKRYTLKANEIKALQDLVAYHDDLLDHITVLEMEQAIARAKAHILQKTSGTALKYMILEAGV